MKLIKKCIIITIILIIIIILAIIMRKESIPNGALPTAEYIVEEYIDNINMKQVSNDSMFYTVSRCIQMYLSYSYLDTFDGMSQEQLEEEKNYTYSAIFNMLSKEYIEKNNITESNISNYVKASEIPLMFYPTSMNYIDGEKVQVYSVYGYIENGNDNTFIQDAYFIVYLDRSNNTFSIEMLDSSKITNINDIQLTNSEEAIEKNDYNTFKYSVMNDENMSEKYLSNYKKLAISYPEKAYNVLNEEYRNTRFGSLEAYKEYVKNNYEQLSKIELDKYQKTTTDQYTQYTCIDTDGNYYMFYETDTMQYTLILDTYTIDIPEFTEKYNSADDLTKVGMNIEKINAALNSKDYKYIYSKMTDGFKNNYFNTLEAFAEYMENTFYDKNTITYSEFSNEGKNYMFDIEVSEQYNSFSEPITKTIIMQLKEGTDFVFSFNV